MDFMDRPDTDAMLAAFMDSDFSRDEQAWGDAIESEKPPDESYLPEPDAEGNYSTPVLDRLQQYWGDFHAGRLDDEQMEEALDRCLDLLDNMMMGMQQTVTDGLDDPNNPVAIAIRTGFYEHREGVSRMKEFFSSRDTAIIEEGMEKAQLGTNRLMDAYGFFQRLRSEVMRIFCPYCQAENRRGATKCSSCNQALPDPEVGDANDTQLLAVADAGAALGEGETRVTTPNFVRIETALRAFEEQTLDEDEFYGELDAVEQAMLSHKEANLREKPDMAGLPGNDKKVLAVLVDGIDQALDANLEALARMKQYFDDGDPDHLKEGFEELARATQSIIEAYQASQSVVNQSGSENEEGELA